MVKGGTLWTLSSLGEGGRRRHLSCQTEATKVRPRQSLSEPDHVRG